MGELIAPQTAQLAWQLAGVVATVYVVRKLRPLALLSRLFRSGGPRG